MTKSSFTERMRELIDASGKLHREIAVEVGYPRPNVISMIRTGCFKVPLEKVTPLARALGADPAFMLRLYLEEHEPERLEAIQGALGEILSANERELLAAIRRASNGRDPPASVVLPALLA